MYKEKLKSIIENSNNIVFFGGAGVSTESGIPDFRSSEGIYSKRIDQKISPEEIISHSFFKRNTEEFFKFYKENMIYTDVKPNTAHIVLAELEREGKLKAIVTQNIDGLHQMAGSKNVLELHGSIHRNYCENCGKKYSLDYIINSDGVPRCTECNGIVRPDVVLYEESLDMEVLERAVDFIQKADVLIVGGTSLVVYPAAGLIRYYGGDKLILINKSETPYDNRALLTFNDSIGKVLGYLKD
jgi:NAD-dependent deacetylase